MKKLLILSILAMLLLAACVNPGMIWNASTPYNFGDMALVSVNGTYQTYASLMDNNIGHYPPDNPSVWGK